MTTKNLIYTGLAVVGAVVVFNYVAKQMKKGKGISPNKSLPADTASAKVSTENNK